MPNIVSRNTIKLSPAASAIDNYYNGYTIILTRYNETTGKQLVQKKKIVAYNGNLRIATIDGLWDTDFIPNPTDIYQIVPTYPDSRVSINFAIQTLDYITSVRYGKGLDPHKDLDLPSWLEAARACDAQSDVTVKVTSDFSTVSEGDVYRYVNGRLHFQGVVHSTKPGYIRFTKIIGKLANKWNSWKSFYAGALIYNETRLYTASADGTVPTAPTHTSGEANGLSYVNSIQLTKLSGTGPATLNIAVDGNPVRDVNAKGITISGYSLYDADGVDYWRYAGWDEHSQRFATRHQGNLTIDTSIPVFDNINNLLEHFGGILRYSSGKYYLDVEEGEGDIPNADYESRNINADYIIGRIRITDEGVRNSYNSLTVAYADPGNKFEAKNISFFNSDFLKADRNIPKKGNVSIPGITNYYSARLLADKFLMKSRYGLTISFNMHPRGALLLSGSVIQVQNQRYGWNNKKFRIINITHNIDTSVDIVAEEYDDKFYAISNISRSPVKAGQPNIVTDLVPGELIATGIDSQDEVLGGIELTWENNPKMDSTVSTEIFASFQPKLFIYINQITLNRVFHTEFAHNLKVGDYLTSKTGLRGLQNDRVYYVSAAPTDKTFVLKTEKDGLEIVPENGINLNLKMMTGTILATVEYPINSYIDVINAPVDEDVTPIDPEAPPPEEEEEEIDPAEQERVRKYYWIRNRISRS